MSFPTPSLDDRTFQEIVDEAKRLIPKYCPEWTNHNLSDPGVALIELFAWMTEMMLYRINQIPDRFYGSFLNLVGIKPFDAAPARADLTFWLSAVEAEPVLIPAGTQVGTLQTVGQPSIVFMTDEDLRIAQPHMTAFVTTQSGSDRPQDQWEDLQYERASVVCFTSEPLEPGDAFHVGFEETIAGNTIRLDVEAEIQGLGVAPERPPLRWETWSGQQWIPVTVHEDTTGGINRDGSVTLIVPMRCEALTLGPFRAFWLRGVLLRTEPDQPPYERSPEIRNLRAVSLGGTVPARHSQPVGEEFLGFSDGEPGQSFQVAYRPLLERRPEERVQVIVDNEPEDWQEIETFEKSERDDRHYRWDSTTGTITFGPSVMYPDGSRRQHGAIPPGGASIRVTGYRYGGGMSGNVGAGTLTVLRTTIPYIDRVGNRRPARGGTDAETIENAKVRGPMTLRTGERAVTVADFERLTLEAASTVARARCLPPGAHGGPIRLLLVPRVDLDPEVVRLDDFAIGENLVDAVREHLDSRRILGTSVEIMAPYYEGVSVVARVTPEASRNRDLVRSNCLRALYRYIHPLVGGPDGRGWPFSWDINAGAVFQLLNGVDGVKEVEDVVLFTADLRLERRYGLGKERIQLSDHSLFASFDHYVLLQ